MKMTVDARFGLLDLLSRSVMVSQATTSAFRVQGLTGLEISKASNSLEEISRHSVFKLLLYKGKITQDLINRSPCRIGIVLIIDKKCKFFYIFIREERPSYPFPK